MEATAQNKTIAPASCLVRSDLDNHFDEGLPQAGQRATKATQINRIIQCSPLQPPRPPTNSYQSHRTELLPTVVHSRREKCDGGGGYASANRKRQVAQQVHRKTRVGTFAIATRLQRTSPSNSTHHTIFHTQHVGKHHHPSLQPSITTISTTSAISTISTTGASQ